MTASGETTPRPGETGPFYPIMPAMNKWRALARERKLTPDEEHAAAQVLFRNIAALKRKEALVGLHFPGPRETHCASGYAYGDAAGMRAHIRAQHRAALQRPGKARTDAEVCELYAKAMAEKRARPPTNVVQIAPAQIAPAKARARAVVAMQFVPVPAKIARVAAKRGVGAQVAAEERARAGILPPVPVLAPASRDRFALLRASLIRAATNHSLSELRGIEFSTKTHSQQKLERYRQLAIIATEARLEKLRAARLSRHAPPCDDAQPRSNASS